MTMSIKNKAALERANTKKEKAEIEADLIAAEKEHFKNQPEPKRGVLIKNMTQKEYDEYKKKYPDGQPNIEINIVKEKKAKGGIIKKYAKGGMANKKPKKAGRLAKRGYGIARK